jgi:hypothetical protein
MLMNLLFKITENENDESCILRPPDFVGGLWWKGNPSEDRGEIFASPNSVSMSLVKSTTEPV